MAQLVLGVAGAVVGSFFGMPQLGFALGSMIGSTLGPSQKVEGPRLADLKAPQASYGAPICYAEGTPRLAGCIAWASDKREIATTTEQGGKGGPSVESTTYTYEIDVLFELTINPMAGVRRIWKHGELIWSAADDADDATLAASAGATIPDQGDAVQATGQTDHWRELRVYSGSASQMPDPTYEAAVGAGNAPAYRGRGTVMIEGLNLGASGQMPVLTWEVVGEGDLTAGIHFREDFSDPDRYGLLGGDADVFDYVGSTYGTALQVIGGASGVTTSTFGGTFSATNIEFVSASWKFRMDSLPTPDPEDLIVEDAPFFELRDLATNPVFLFWGARENSFDTLQRPMLGINGGASIPIHTNHVTAGVWYVVTVAITSTTKATITLTVASSGEVVNVEEYTGDFTSPFAAAGMRFYDTSFFHVAEKPGCSFTDIDLGAGAGTITPTDVMLSDVVERLSVRAGLSSADLDVTALSSTVVRALAVSQVTPTRQVLDMLSSAYLFEFVESDKLRAVLRGGASVASIPFADLGASNGEPGEPLPLRRVNDIELPAQVTVKYANTINDFQDGAESGDRLVTDSTAVSVIEFPIGMTPTEAKRLADVATMDIAASMLAIGPVSVTREHAKLEPTDVVTLTAESGSTFRARILKINDAAGVRTMDLTLDDATAINSVAATDSSYTSSTLVRPLADTDLELLDIPLLRDADDGPGICAAFGATGKWPGAALLRSVDDVEHAEVLRVTDRAVMGQATTALADWTGGNVFDEASSVTVDVGSGTLSSVTRDQILNDRSRNALLIGDEIVQFRDADLQSAGVYILTGFLRGRRGTERAMGGHALGDRVVLLRTTGLRHVAHEQSEIGVLRYWKGVTFGKSLASAETHEFTDTGVALKPFSPVHVAASRASDGAITLEWTRRTRLATRFVGTAGINVPLGEDSEAYSVDVMDGDTVVRTLTSSSESVTYSAADQTTDFGSTQASVTVRVHQLSETVGRGYAAEATV